MTLVGFPTWMGAILGAWAISPELGCAVTLGYIIQWTLKAPSGRADWMAPAAAVVVGGLLFVFVLGHDPREYETWQRFVTELSIWVGSVLGSSSAAGATGGAPKTNSI